MENRKQDKASLQKTEFRVRESVTCGEGISTPTTSVLRWYL